MDIKTIVSLMLETLAGLVAIFLMFQNNLKKNKSRFDEIDARLDMQYKFIRSAVITSGIAVGWENETPFITKVKALLLNIWLGENGNTIKRLKEIVISKEKGIEDFETILNEFIQVHGDNKEFEEAMAKVKAGLM